MKAEETEFVCEDCGEVESLCTCEDGPNTVNEITVDQVRETGE